MASFYQSLLGIIFAVVALGAGVVAAAYQLLASQVSTAVARLVLRSRALWLGVALTLVAAAVAMAGSLLLARPHDLLAANLRTDELLSHPLVGLACSLALAIGGLAMLSAGLRAIRLLDVDAAAEALSRNTHPQDLVAWAIGSAAELELQWDDAAEEAEGLDDDASLSASLHLHKVNSATSKPDTSGLAEEDRRLIERLWTRKELRQRTVRRLRSDAERGRITDRLASFDQLLDVTAQAGRAPLVESIAQGHLVRLNPNLAASSGISRRESIRLLGDQVFDRHLLPLARRWADRGDFESIAALARAAAAVGADTDDAWFEAAQTFTMKAAPLLLRRAAPGPLCSVIRSIAEFAIKALERENPEGFHDEACRALGGLGQQIPAAFHHPSDPEVSLIPESLRYESADPLGCLQDAFYEIKRATFDGDERRVDSLIWRDGVLVTAQALAHRAAHVFQDDRLEQPLVSAMLLLAKLGTQGARDGDERRATIAAFALGELAEDADQAFYREYPSDIAMALVEIALFASVHSLHATDGRALAAWIADDLVEKLRELLSYPMHEALVAGRFSPAPQDVRWAFVKSVGVLAHDNFGFRFDPMTGDDYPPLP
jgi:hypothetical protein